MFKDAERLNPHYLNATLVGAIMDFTPNNTKPLREELIRLSGHRVVATSRNAHIPDLSFMIQRMCTWMESIY